MKKSVIVLFAVALFSLQAMAQSIQEGVSNLYAERYQSARSVFEKLTQANPNNLEAAYWLGETYIAQGDVNAARALFQRYLGTNGNAPWILAGMGHVNLLDGKAAEARQQFEQAITASKQKKNNDPGILDAIGRANVQAYTDDNKLGDLNYAISKLNEAAEIAPTNPDIFINLGNAYRKLHQGGDAVLAYRKAGNNAMALYRTASIYNSQHNWDAMLENLNAAIAADPKFAPAYEALYVYNLFEKRDFPEAERVGKLLVSNSDPSPENDYFLAQTIFVQDRFQDAVNIANKIVSQTNNNPKPRVYRLLAYSYLGLKDTAKACEFSNQFLAKAKEEDLLSNDYLLHAEACAKNNPALLTADITKAVTMDSVLSRQIKTLNEAIANARKQNQPLLEATLMLFSHRLRGTQANPADLFYIGTRLYTGGDYPKADSVLGAYVTAFPDTLQGYYWRGIVRSRIDTSMTEGLAIPDFEKTLQLAESDKVRFKSQGVQAAQILAIYYTNVKNDRTTALADLTRGLAFDPTDQNLLTLQQQISGGSAKGKEKDPDTGEKTKVKVTDTKTKTKTKER